MRIAQIIFPSASQYERKCQRVDHEALSAAHDVILASVDEARLSGADIAHVYATGELPGTPFVRFPLPWVSSADVHRSRWPFRKPVQPGYVVSPLTLTEAVEGKYFVGERGKRNGEKNVIGTFARASVQQVVELTLARIHRFREDVTWHLFDRVPEPADLAEVDVWVDPAVEETDYDGFVAEALVVGLPVVASRVKLNTMRLEHGRTGFLIPPRDPNELAHAILAALFKPEMTTSKWNAAKQTASKFRAKQRLRALLHMYQTLIP
jgi:hypothetical protein